MKWQGRRKSSNVRRGKSGGGPIVVGGGIGGVIILLLYFLLGGDPSQLPQQSSSQYYEQEASGEEKVLEDFLSVVLADTEDVWHEKFNEYGYNYVEPKMTLFNQNTQSGCGLAQSNMGPFYCPIDESVYIDVSFYNDLKRTFGVEGDFAFAYVLAHEVGHHVQNQLNILGQVQPLRNQLSDVEYNKYSVAMELQADYFAGLFAYYVQEKGYLEEGDIDEAMSAASAIGDDRIQEMSGQEVNVDTFTHGTSEQRKNAFDQGFSKHDLEHSMQFFDGLEYKPEV
jgi:predicted metalloprotease